MEGLIPYLLHAIKKQRPNHHSFRCLSDASNRSYHLLIGADSAAADGSSHRGRRLQPPAALDHFSDQRSPRVNYLSNGGGSMMSPVASKTAVTSGYQASFSMAGTVTHRR
nr:putative beta-D-xylosidase 5-like protein [Ipomoea batatas]